MSNLEVYFKEAKDAVFENHAHPINAEILHLYPQLEELDDSISCAKVYEILTDFYNKVKKDGN